VEGLRSNFDHRLSHLFIQFLVIISVSRAMGKMFARLGQPEVIGEMAAGILLGPSLFGLLAPDLFAFVFPKDSLGTLKLLSQIGVCLFMFAVGMELDLKHVKSKAQAAVAVSHASIVFPYLLGVCLAYFMFSQLAQPGSTFIAFALFNFKTAPVIVGGDDCVDYSGVQGRGDSGRFSSIHCFTQPMVASSACSLEPKPLMPSLYTVIPKAPLRD
jgi:Sodium/hydrogen exchanger family